MHIFKEAIPHIQQQQDHDYRGQLLDQTTAPVMWQDGLHICIKWVFRAVVHAKGIASIHHTSCMIIREHGIWPVEVRRHDELHDMATTQVYLVSTLDSLLLEGPAGHGQVCKHIHKDDNEAKSCRIAVIQLQSYNRAKSRGPKVWSWPLNKRGHACGIVYSAGLGSYPAQSIQVHKHTSTQQHAHAAASNQVTSL